MDFEADYLIIGAGAMGLAFALPLPVPVTDTLADFVRGLPGDMANRYACSKHPLVRDLDPEDAARQAIVRELAEASRAAAANLPRLMASLPPAAEPGAEAAR